MLSFVDQKAETTAIDLGVEVVGMDIIVKSGSFQVGGEEFDLDEDVVFAAKTRTNNVWVDASLVRDTNSGEITVLVDERESDGVTFDLPFEFAGSSYEKLYSIFEIGIPAGAINLSGLDLRVYRVVIPQPIATPISSKVTMPTTARR